MLTQPAFPRDEVAYFRSKLLSGLDQEKEEPDHLAWRAFLRAAYPPGHPLRPPTLAEAREGLRRTGDDEPRQFYERQYGPEHLLVVVAGDVKPQHVRAALARSLGGWRRNPGAPGLPPAQRPPATPGSREWVPVAGKREASVVWGFAGNLRTLAPDYNPALVLQTILVGPTAVTGRLGELLRERRGVTYGVSGLLGAYQVPGPFAIQFETLPDDARRSVDLVTEAVRRVRSDGVNSEEVSEAVGCLTGRYLVGLDTNAGEAESLLHAESYWPGAAHVDDFPARLREVTVSQVNAAARRHLRPEAAVSVVAGPWPSGAGGGHVRNGSRPAQAAAAGDRPR